MAWVSTYGSIQELISRINGGKYGIHCGAFTDHWPTIAKLYEELEVGGLLINDVPTTRYDHQPYGGVKESGMGREGIRSAMDEMTDVKFLAL
jgi:acyl-CoA reductase-like NAD-dependent aldehyde dehydrogenase